MSKITAAITGVAGYVPDFVLTNAMLEEMVDTNDEWIKTRTGIEERRILKGEGLGASDMGIEAVEQLLKQTGTAKDEVDMMIVTSATSDYRFPDTGNIICDKMGIKNAVTFDLGAACSGFIFALEVAQKFVISGSHKKVIVVGSDKMSSIVDYTDRSTCIIFGDGAGAVMVEPNHDGFGVIDSILKSDGTGRHYLYQKAGGSAYPATLETVKNKDHFIYQDGRPVFKAAVKGMADVVTKVMKRNNLSVDDVTWVVPHQANLRIIEAVARLGGIPMEKVMVTIQKYGNTTTATIPLCLRDYEPRLKKGDNVILTAFGGGYTWGATYLKWAY